MTSSRLQLPTLTRRQTPNGTYVYLLDGAVARRSKRDYRAATVRYDVRRHLPTVDRHPDTGETFEALGFVAHEVADETTYGPGNSVLSGRTFYGSRRVWQHPETDELFSRGGTYDDGLLRRPAQEEVLYYVEGAAELESMHARPDLAAAAADADSRRRYAGSRRRYAIELQLDETQQAEAEEVEAQADPLVGKRIELTNVDGRPRGVVTEVVWQNSARRRITVALEGVVVTFTYSSRGSWRRRAAQTHYAIVEDWQELRVDGAVQAQLEEAPVGDRYAVMAHGRVWRLRPGLADAMAEADNLHQSLLVDVAPVLVVTEAPARPGGGPWAPEDLAHDLTIGHDLEVEPDDDPERYGTIWTRTGRCVGEVLRRRNDRDGFRQDDAYVVLYETALVSQLSGFQGPVEDQREDHRPIAHPTDCDCDQCDEARHEARQVAPTASLEAEALAVRQLRTRTQLAEEDLELAEEERRGRFQDALRARCVAAGARARLAARVRGETPPLQLQDPVDDVNQLRTWAGNRWTPDDYFEALVEAGAIEAKLDDEGQRFVVAVAEDVALWTWLVLGQQWRLEAGPARGAATGQPQEAQT